MSRLVSLLMTYAPAAVVLIRLSVGAVFLSEGIQKFLYQATLGVGRFQKIGFEAAATLALFVGTFEILCGALVLLGLATRFAAIPLACIMLTAIVTTKLPIPVGHDLWGFHVRQMPEYGFWAMAHEARTDFAMLLAPCSSSSAVESGRWTPSSQAIARKGQVPRRENP